MANKKLVCEGKEHKTSAEWIEDVNAHPEKFGVSRAHITSVNKNIKNAIKKAEYVPRQRKTKPADEEVLPKEIEKKSEMPLKEKWW